MRLSTVTVAVFYWVAGCQHTPKIQHRSPIDVQPEFFQSVDHGICWTFRVDDKTAISFDQYHQILGSKRVLIDMRKDGDEVVVYSCAAEN